MRIKRFALTAVSAGVFSVASGLVAFAADMPLKAPRQPVATYYNWTGFYIGANAGYGWGTSAWRDDPNLGATDLGSHAIRGGMIGGQIGYNLQVSNWVVGIEGDLDWSNIKGGHVDVLGSDINTKVTALGTVTGRVGYAQGPALFYGKGGAAWGRFKYDDFTAPGGALNGAHSSSRWGYTFGGGLEYAFGGNWSAKIEYDYMDFGTKRLNFSGGAGGAFVQDITDRIHVVKAGVNYRFGR
jgi:outer membrane immunogenic protein